MLKHRDDSTNDAGGKDKQSKPEQCKTNAVFRWDGIQRKEGHNNSISCTQTHNRNWKDSNAACHCQHEKKEEIRNMYIEELSNEIQLGVKHNPAENGKKEWYDQASKAGKVLIE